MKINKEARTQFAQNLKARRKELGFSQEALAEMCEMDRTAISLLERAKRSPRLDTLVGLSRALQLESPARLLDGLS